MTISQKNFKKPNPFTFTYYGKLTNSSESLSYGGASRYRNNNLNQIRYKYAAPAQIIKVGDLGKAKIKNIIDGKSFKFISLFFVTLLMIF